MDLQQRTIEALKIINSFTGIDPVDLLYELDTLMDLDEAVKVVNLELVNNEVTEKLEKIAIRLREQNKWYFFKPFSNTFRILECKQLTIKKSDMSYIQYIEHTQDENNVIEMFYIVLEFDIDCDKERDTEILPIVFE